MKVCYRCRLELADECFHRAPGNRDGLGSWCKRCVTKSQLAKYHSLTKEQHKVRRAKQMASRRRRYATDPNYRVLRCEVARRHYWKYREQQLAARRAYRRLHGALPTKQLAKDVVVAIYVSAAKKQELRDRFNVTLEQVRRIKKRETYRQYTEHLGSPGRYMKEPV